jgi:hypothetical protein
MACFSITVPANGVVSGKGDTALPSAGGAGLTPSMRSRSAGGGERRLRFLVFGVGAQVVLAGDDLVAVEHLGALEVGLGQRLRGRAWSQAECASPTSRLSSTASVWPALTASPRLTWALTMRPGTRGATWAMRSWLGRMVAVTPAAR